MQGCELLSVAEMAEADRLAIASGQAGLQLMERAGRAVAAEAMRLLGSPAAIFVACGPGNNGGDGFVAARILRQHGYRVRLGLMGDSAALKGDAAAMAARWGEAPEALAADAVGGAGDLIIDALFGAGLSRPLDGEAAQIVAAINASGKAVLAVDVPSGLNGSTGLVEGASIAATHTVTFFRLKPGHVLLPGRERCGQVRLADIGIPEETLATIAPRTFLNRPALWRPAFPRVRAQGHKYQRGHTVVVSGPAESTGAARLGARAALRMGSGLVTLVGSAAATAVNATHATAVMVKALSSDAELAHFLSDERRNAVLIGPGAGVGRATAASVLTVLATPAAVVLDADALTSFAPGAEAGEVRAVGFGFVVRDREPPPGRHALFAALKARQGPVVLTPHDGEFKRLFGELPGSKLDRARVAAELSGAVIISKGADTVVAAPDGRAAINDNAPAWLATAGAGDVLAGFVAGLTAQRMGAFEAACAAVWLHGATAAQFGPGLIAEDLPETLPQVLARVAPLLG
jgi:ADP-dependent NAD(P)H-hydrate dehydratase / NAD(P)H-hydrate epimerase